MPLVKFFVRLGMFYCSAYGMHSQKTSNFWPELKCSSKNSVITSSTFFRDFVAISRVKINLISEHSSLQCKNTNFGTTKMPNNETNFLSNQLQVIFLFHNIFWNLSPSTFSITSSILFL